MSKKRTLIINGKAPHTDDIAVEVFANAMSRKLAAKRTEGRGGWEECDPFDLAYMLVEHITRGDPVDIANFAMFLGSVRVSKARVRRALKDAMFTYVAQHTNVHLTTAK